MKKCNHCNKNKKNEEFLLIKRLGRSRRCSRCRSCDIERKKEYGVNYIDTVFNSLLSRKWGLS